MTTETKILSIITAFAFLLGAAATATLARVTADPAPTYLDHIMFTCQSFDVAEDLGDGNYGPGIGPDLAGILFDAGWKGIPGDGREAIYSPAC